MNVDSSGSFFKASPPDLSRKTLGAAAAGAARTGPAGLASPPVGSSAATAQLLSTHTDFDAAKVAEIRASIRAGCYAVDTGRIADGLLASAQELLHPPAA
jgi:negative regulator of flagellin synthesis FlgM